MKLPSLLLISLLTINFAHANDKYVYSDLYEFIFRDEIMTWDNARDDCRRFHAELVKVNTTAITKIIITNFLSGSPYNVLWIGASDRKKEGDWIWLDGSTAPSEGIWSTHEPDNWNNMEHCAYVYDNGKLGDLACSTLLKFICQKVLPVNLKREDHIFTIHRHPKLSYLQAEDACADSGERLVEIYDEGTDALIRENLKQPDSQFLIGGTVTNGHVTWQSGKESTYARWVEGFPQSTKGRYITATVSGWKNNITRTDMIPYICEKVHMSRVTLNPNLPKVNSAAVSEINCSGNGIPQPTVYWTDSSVNVTQQGSSVYETRSPGFSILHVSNALFTDDKTYTCIAINATGGRRIRVKRSFKLTVPSSPRDLEVYAEYCTSTLTVVWRPNHRAVNMTHWIQISTDDDKEVHETYVTPATADYQVHKQTVRPWSMFTVKVMPYLQTRGQCQKNYMLSNRTRQKTVGLPQEVANLYVSKSNSTTCYIAWEKPTNVPEQYITKYKIYINGSNNWVYPGKLRNETSFSDIVTNDNTTYNYSGKPNSIYHIGVQAYTCAGPGNISWYAKNCTTDFEDSLYLDLYELVFRTVKKSWQNAKEECKIANATLIQIDSADLKEIIKKWSDRWWIGASDKEAAGTWQLLDETSTTIETTAP